MSILFICGLLFITFSYKYKMYRRFFNFGLSTAFAFSLTIPSYRKSYKCIWPWAEEVEQI